MRHVESSLCKCKWKGLAWLLNAKQMISVQPDSKNQVHHACTAVLVISCLLHALKYLLQACQALLCLQSVCATHPALHRDADGLWYAFLDYLRSPAGSDEMAMKELERRLQAIKDRLTSRGAGPYLQVTLSSLYPIHACGLHIHG